MSNDLALPGPEVPVIDADRLLAEFGGSQEILDELRDLFLEHAPPMYDSIMDAVQNQDAAALSRDAHSFKGACATYGAARLSQVCKIFELSAKAGNWGPIQENLDAFKQEYEAVTTELAKVAAE